MHAHRTRHLLRLRPLLLDPDLDRAHDHVLARDRFRDRVLVPALVHPENQVRKEAGQGRQQ
jgi:hypothetical protein